MDKLWIYVKSLSKRKRPVSGADFRIDLVADNASYELFTDLCLVEFLHRSNLLPRNRTKVYFHLKNIPWFVSDTMMEDFKWLLDVLQQREDFAPQLKKLGKRFQQNIDDQVWILEQEQFWTLPYDYSQMVDYDSELYRTLCSTDLLIIKGDLNYRKLMGDLRWPPTATFRQGLRRFQPTTAICSLRTIKADVLVGIENQATLELIESFPNKEWMETGEFAVIHFLNNNDNNINGKIIK